MRYKNMVTGIFIERPNRFIARCEVEGEEVIVHVKNTGRCKELLVPGCKVYLQNHDNPKRKTKYSLISVEKGERLINMDSQVPNHVVYEAIRNGTINLPECEKGQVTIKPEQKYGNSRFDARMQTANFEGFIEVKGVTLEENGVVRFPDAPTERGLKHVEELIGAVEDGYRGYIIFVIQMSDVKFFEPNRKTHVAFAEGLHKAKEKGVYILAYDCRVTKTQIEINQEVEVRL